MRRKPQRAAFCLAVLAVSASAPAAEIAAPYVPTAPSVVERMLDIAQVGPQDYVIDLGSGDGRINILAAQKHGARGHGLEIDPKLNEKARENARAAGVADRVSFVTADLFTADLSKATVVTMYLLARSTRKLQERLYALAPGTRIVSHAGSMGDWKADRFEMLEVPDRVRADAPRKTYIHFWVVPAKVAGRWTSSQSDGGAERRCELELTQRYQIVEGTLGCEGEPAAAASGRLQGTRLTLDLGRTDARAAQRRIEARIEADAMHGTLAGAVGAAAWQATRNAAPR